MEPTRLTLEGLSRFLPPQEELEELRFCLADQAAPDPAMEWSKASVRSTLDKWVVEPAGIEAALVRAETAYHDYVGELFGRMRAALSAGADGRDAEAALRLVELGELQERRGRPRRAREIYETALAASVSLADRAPQTLALRRMGRSGLAAGELNDALACYQRSAALARDAQDVRGEVIALTGAGNVRSVQGWWAEAEQCYAPALEIVRGAHDPAELALERAQLCNNLGLVSIRLGRPEEAERWLAEALACWAELDAPDDLAVCLHNQAMLREQQGQWEEAQQIRIRALELAVAPASRAVIAIDLAQGWVRLGRMSEAERCGREAERYAVAARSPYHLGHMYRGLGNIARVQKDEDGFTFFEKALELARAHALPYLEGETLIDYAGLRAESGQPEEAAAYLQRAGEILDRSGAVYERDRAALALRSLRAEPSAPPAAG